MPWLEPFEETVYISIRPAMDIWHGKWWQLCFSVSKGHSDTLLGAVPRLHYHASGNAWHCPELPANNGPVQQGAWEIQVITRHTSVLQRCRVWPQVNPSLPGLLKRLKLFNKPPWLQCIIIWLCQGLVYSFVLLNFDFQFPLLLNNAHHSTYFTGILWKSLKR